MKTKINYLLPGLYRRLPLEDFYWKIFLYRNRVSTSSKLYLEGFELKLTKIWIRTIQIFELVLMILTDLDHTGNLLE